MRVAWCDLHGVHARQDADARRGGRCAARRRGPGQHADAEGHLRPHRVQGVRAGRRRRAAGLRPGQQPAAAGRPGELSQPAVGARHRLDARRSRGSTTATPVELDTRRVLQRALAELPRAGFGLRCGLEVEFHIYRIDDDAAQLDPQQAAWPGRAAGRVDDPPGLQPARRGLGRHGRRAAAHRAAHRAGAGPAAAVAGDRARVRARSRRCSSHRCADRGRPDGAVPQRRAPGAAPRRLPRQLRLPAAVSRTSMASGWHLHQSLVALRRRRQRVARDAPAPGTTPSDARFTLSDVGEHYLAGLLAHARAMAVFCTPTINGFGRFRPNALAPQAVLWGRDNRGAMLRVLGALRRRGDAHREPHRRAERQSLPLHRGADPRRTRRHAARPARRRRPPMRPMPPARRCCRRRSARRCRRCAAERRWCARSARRSSTASVRIKRAELARYEQAADKDEWQRREYFSRF